MKSGTVRTFPLGMDRYRRYYWCIPSFKGVLVESSESAIHPTSSGDSDCHLRLAEPKSEAKEEKYVKAESQLIQDIKSEKEEEPSEKDQAMEAKSEPKSEPEINVTDLSPVKSETVKLENKMDTTVSSNIEQSMLDKSSDSKIGNDVENQDSSKPQQTSLTNNSSPHSPLTSLHKEETKDQISRPNGVNNSHSPHSIASWLSSTIDSIFIRENATTVTSEADPMTSTSQPHAPPITSQHTITTQSGDVKNIIIPSQPLATASAYILPTTVDDQWFELSR